MDRSNPENNAARKRVVGIFGAEADPNMKADLTRFKQRVFTPEDATPGEGLGCQVVLGWPADFGRSQGDLLIDKMTGAYTAGGRRSQLPEISQDHRVLKYIP